LGYGCRSRGDDIDCRYSSLVRWHFSLIFRKHIQFTANFAFIQTGEQQTVNRGTN
jgi:hypothetical protein